MCVFFLFLTTPCVELSVAELTRIFPHLGLDELPEFMQELRQANSGTPTFDSQESDGLAQETQSEAAPAPVQRRAPHTTANDWCRLVHIAGDPALLGAFSTAYRPLTRPELDTPLEDRHSGWGAIANAFNDIEGFAYQNPTKVITGDRIRAAAGMEVAYGACGDWNPVDASRPTRDVVWFRSRLNDLRARFSRARANYHRSGNHDAEEPIDEFANFCTGDHVVLYAFVVWGDATQGFFDRALPQDMQREEGLGAAASANPQNVEETSPSVQGKRPASSHKARAQKRRRETAELQLIETQLANQSAIREWFQHSAAAQVKNAEIAQKRMEFDTLQRIAGDASLHARIREAAAKRLEMLLLGIGSDVQNQEDGDIFHSSAGDTDEPEHAAGLRNIARI